MYSQYRVFLLCRLILYMYDLRNAMFFHHHDHFNGFQSCYIDSNVNYLVVLNCSFTSTKLASLQKHGLIIWRSIVYVWNEHHILYTRRRPDLFGVRMFVGRQRFVFLALAVWFKLAGWLSGWLVGCLPAWLAGWLAAWLAGWLPAWLAGWLTALLAGCLPAWLAGCLPAWLAGWPAGWVAGLLAG